MCLRLRVEWMKRVVCLVCLIAQTSEEGVEGQEVDLLKCNSIRIGQMYMLLSYIIEAERLGRFSSERDGCYVGENMRSTSFLRFLNCYLTGHTG